MAKNIHSKNQTAKNQVSRNQMGRPSEGSLDPNELKSLIRDGLVAMNMTDREAFIRALEAEMRRINLNMRAYLIPLGIPGRSPEDLTPTEVGHLIRFLKMNVPQAMTAVERAVSSFDIFHQMMEQSGHKLAA
ncbi:MAG TPA: hypothetical protein VFQ92_14035 [Blastocatellia bacterium]|nr:hypothetical protein [Blastocatellia bacterium]